MFSFCTDTSTKSRTPLVDRIVSDAFFHDCPTPQSDDASDRQHVLSPSSGKHVPESYPHSVIHNVEKILKIGQYLSKIWEKYRGPFLTHIVAYIWGRHGQLLNVGLYRWGLVGGRKLIDEPIAS